MKADKITSLSLIITISLLLPALWLKDSLPIAYLEGGLFYFLADPGKTLKITSFMWWDIFALGSNNSSSMTLIIYNLFILGLNLLGFSALLRQYVIFSIILLISGLSIYFIFIDI